MLEASRGLLPASGSNLVGRDKTKHYGHYQEGDAEIGASSDTVRPEFGQHSTDAVRPGDGRAGRLGDPTEDERRGGERHRPRGDTGAHKPGR